MVAFALCIEGTSPNKGNGSTQGANPNKNYIQFREPTEYLGYKAAYNQCNGSNDYQGNCVVFVFNYGSGLPHLPDRCSRHFRIASACFR